MSYDSQNPWTAGRGGVATQAGYDLGLRQYMLRVYNYMAAGLAVTGVVAWLSYDSGLSLQIAQTPLRWVVMLAPLAFIFMIYTHGSIATTFFIAATMFLGMSLYGYTTKADLTRMGSFMMMGLIGIIIASLVNMFLASSAMYFAISVIGVVVFTGLTAWDTQRIAQQYYYPMAGSGDMVGKGALMGALQLYLDFLNLFLMLLRLFGNSRN